MQFFRASRSTQCVPNVLYIMSMVTASCIGAWNNLHNKACTACPVTAQGTVILTLLSAGMLPRC